MKKIILIVFFILSIHNTNAEFLLATGVSSITGGRVNPLLNTGFDSSNFSLSFSSLGVKNDVYYHSGYTLVTSIQGELGDYLWGNLRGGVGLGLHFAKRGLDDGNGLEEKSDFAIGPSIRVTWTILPKVFIGLESIYGIRDANVILLSTQNIHSMMFGARF